MLLELDVRDLGIIEHVNLLVPPGFTVLSGETGAGKSLLVQSLQLLAGGRADAELVRASSERLVVTARFVRPRAGAAAGLLDELAVEAAEELLIRREVSANGRSRAFVNDIAVTVSTLQRLAPHLISIDGQHEQRGLADPSTHLALADEAGDLGELRGQVSNAFLAWQEVRRELEQQAKALAGRRDRLDVIAFQTREIEELRPIVGEDEQLQEERTLLRHTERIGELLGQARAALGGEGGSVALARAARAVQQLADLRLSVTGIGEDLEQARLLAEEAERALLALADRVRSDPQRLDEVESHLAGLERLKRKYGGSLAAVLEHLARLNAERLSLEGAEDDMVRLEDEQIARAEQLARLATLLSARRVAAADRFCHAVANVLMRLGMPEVRLALALRRRLAQSGSLEVEGERVEPAEDGIDVGEFVFSPNPGEAPRSMARIASGGELSRVHLAMRTVLREEHKLEDSLTLLFDEVDSGIGGRVADELGELLADQGEHHQVLVVTHLPQVAGRAGAHFVVQKRTVAGRTVAEVAGVVGPARVEELVRMLGGGADTPAAWQHARELLSRRRC